MFLEAAIQHEPHPVWKNIGQGMIACVRGDEAAGILIADELIVQREIFNAAEIYNLCGDTKKVFALLQQAAANREPALTEMKLSWAMSSIRDDPRWREIHQTDGIACYVVMEFMELESSAMVNRNQSVRAKQSINHVS